MNQPHSESSRKSARLTPREGSDAPVNGSSDAAVLIVDDEFAFAGMLKTLLELERFVALIAGNPETALRLMSKHHFDAAILDVRLGERTAAPIADALDERGIPFIFLTGYSDLDELPQRLRQHPCLAKPVPPQVLIEQVKTLTARHKASVRSS
ncbi:MAG: response regulator [Phycisphaeraceae bacterium]|nr:response regulator [Phycisphaeraceae bacterium]